MAPRKRRRNTRCTAASPTPSTLPADLLLEIIARSDTPTFIRCAATGKILRRRILDPSFIHRVTQKDGIIPPCILAYLNTHDYEDIPPPPLTLVNPVTPAAVSFTHNLLSPFMSRNTDDLLREYYPVTSRGGLVLLRRRPVSSSCSILCVYDPITGHHTFLCEPPYIPNNIEFLHKCVLLTAADGISCSFLLLVGDPDRSSSSNKDTTRTIKIQTFASSTGTWGPVSTHGGFFLQRWYQTRRDATAVNLHGGTIHWLAWHGGEIFTYNVRLAEPGTLELPSTATKFTADQLHLGTYSSPDGQKLLRMLAADGFRISMWHQLPSGDWAPESMIDMKEKLGRLDPDIPSDGHVRSFIKCSGAGSSAVLLDITYRRFPNGRTIFRTLPIVLDLETNKMRVQHLDSYSDPSSVVIEVDLPSRIRAMKIFPLDS